MLLLKQNAEYEIKIMGEERMIILNKQTIMLELINKAINAYNNSMGIFE